MRQDVRLACRRPARFPGFTAAAGLGFVIGAGVAAAPALSRVPAGQLDRVSPTDPLVGAGIALLLALVGAVASHLPRRAARVDPMVAIRAD